jgi:ESX secretion system protein EccE
MIWAPNRAARIGGRVPQLTRAQLILLELAAAAVLAGLAAGVVWPILGAAAGGVLVLAAVVPVRRRWLYQLALSWFALLRRRRRSGRLSGLAGLFGEYDVESVPGGGDGSRIGVVRSGTTWCLPLVLGLDGVFNDDAAVPVELLGRLLAVEDVRLSSVRLVSLTAPAQLPAYAPAGPVAPATPLAARYCLLTLDTRRAADAIAARGGTEAAVHQILRRCAVHAERTLSTAGLSVRRLDERAVAALFATWLGPSTPSTGRRAPRSVESWRDVRVAGTWSTVFAISGDGGDVMDRIARLAAAAPTPVVATTLLLQPGAAPADVVATLLMRLSGPDSVSEAGAIDWLSRIARAFGLVVQRLDGEQAPLLRATTPLGIGESV